MNFGTNHAPGAGSITSPVNLQSRVPQLCYGCSLVRLYIMPYFTKTRMQSLSNHVTLVTHLSHTSHYHMSLPYAPCFMVTVNFFLPPIPSPRRPECSHKTCNSGLWMAASLSAVEYKQRCNVPVKAILQLSTGCFAEWRLYVLVRAHWQYIGLYIDNILVCTSTLYWFAHWHYTGLYTDIIYSGVHTNNTLVCIGNILVYTIHSGNIVVCTLTIYWFTLWQYTGLHTDNILI